ncbi:MAG: hypothetical protein ACYC3L_03325 [Gemmatimonadaceae bacterium]
MSRILARCTTLALVAAAGCATARPGATPDTTPPADLAPTMQRTVRADGSTVSINTAGVYAGISTPVPAPMDSAWAALKAAYRALGIPASRMVEASHLIENERFKTRRRIGKVPMSRILDCGNSQGLPNADTFEITLSISSYLVKNPTDGLNLVTRIEASGSSPYFSGEAPVNCPTTGELERVIGEMVRKPAAR